MKHRNLNLNTPSTICLGIIATCEILRGGVRLPVGGGKNLVLNKGLEALGNNQSAEVSRYCWRGESDAPNKRDSGSITFSQVGTDLSASSNFFSIEDEGRDFKYDSQEVCTIVSYTDPQNVVVDISRTVAASEGTVHYTERENLENKLDTTGVSSTFDTTFDAATQLVTHTREHQFPALTGGPKTIKELAWGPTTETIYSRLLVNGGSGVVLQDGDILVVTSHNRFKLGPKVAAQVDLAASGGVNLSGSGQINGVGMSIVRNGSTSFYAYDGSGQNNEIYPNGGSRNIFVGSDAAPHQAYGSAAYPYHGNSQTYAFKAATADALSPLVEGFRSRRVWTKFGIAEANQTIAWLGFASQDGAGGVSFRHILDTPFVKAATHELTIGINLVFGRSLEN